MVKKARSNGDFQLCSADQLRIQRHFDAIIAPVHQQNPHALRQPGQRGRVAPSDIRNLLDRLIEHKDAYLRFMMIDGEVDTVQAEPAGDLGG